MNKSLIFIMAIQKAIAKGKAYFDGVGDCLLLDDSPDWDMGNGAFCIEFITAKALNGVTQTFMAQCNNVAQLASTSFKIDFLSTNYVQCVLNGTATKTISSSSTVTDTDDKHYAIASDGTTARLFIGGTLAGSTSVTGFTMNNSTNQLAIGRIGEDPEQYFKGYMKGVRITKGDARYTSDFTPPTEFSVDSANVKLCLRFAEDIGATTFIDDCGKTVATVGNVVIVE